MSLGVSLWRCWFVLHSNVLVSTVFVHERVRQQYESFPYPSVPDDKAYIDDAHKLVGLQAAIHYIYAGNIRRWRNPAPENPLRILNAGAGTGPATIRLAHDLDEMRLPGKVVHLDFSHSSVAAARTRVETLGLSHRVEFERAELFSFVDRHRSNEGSLHFDLIWCTGVLHHLPDPKAGLLALQSILAPSGGMEVMVYGASGRSGIYDLQQAFRYSLPAGEVLSDAERLRELRSFMYGDEESGELLPATSILRSVHEASKHRGIDYLSIVSDKNHQDEELFDMFLHAQDRAYSVVEFDDLVRSAGLRLLTFMPEAAYRPEYTVFLRDAQQSYMYRRIRQRTRIEQFHFTEVTTGRPPCHTAWVAHPDNDLLPENWPPWRNLDFDWFSNATPWISPTAPELIFSEQDTSSMKLAALERKGVRWLLNFKKDTYAAVEVPVPELSFLFLKLAAPGTSTVQQIIDAAQLQSTLWPSQLKRNDLLPLTHQELQAQFIEWLEVFESMTRVFLSSRSYATRGEL